MKNTLSNRRLFLAQSALLLPVLAGCGAAKRLINDQIPAIANPGNLDGKQFPVSVSPGSRVPVSGTGTFVGQFPDIPPVGQQNRLTFVEVSQNLRGEIIYVPANGATFPARFVLNDVSLAVTLGDGAGVVIGSTREVVIPALRPALGGLVFERVADTDRYRWNQSGEIRLGSVRVSGDSAKQLFALLTEADNVRLSTNAVSASLSVSADAQGVERAAGAILFTFGKGEARVGI